MLFGWIDVHYSVLILMNRRQHLLASHDGLRRLSFKMLVRREMGHQVIRAGRMLLFLGVNWAR